MNLRGREPAGGGAGLSGSSAPPRIPAPYPPTPATPPRGGGAHAAPARPPGIRWRETCSGCRSLALAPGAQSRGAGLGERCWPAGGWGRWEGEPGLSFGHQASLGVGGHPLLPARENYRLGSVPTLFHQTLVWSHHL